MSDMAPLGSFCSSRKLSSAWASTSTIALPIAVTSYVASLISYRPPSQVVTPARAGRCQGNELPTLGLQFVSRHYPETNLKIDLEPLDLLVVNVAANLLNLEPVESLEGFSGLVHSCLDCFGDAHIGRSNQFNDFVSVVGHGRNPPLEMNAA